MHGEGMYLSIPSRTVKIAGITPHPDTPWMMQIARNLTDPEDGFLRGKRYLIIESFATLLHLEVQ